MSIYQTSTGNVGIGITAPTAQFHVYQSASTGYQLSVNNVANSGGTNYSSFIHSDQAFCGGVGGVGQYTYSGASLLVTSYPNNTSNNSGYTAYFGTSANDATSLAPQMVIKAATGYVGIGTATPYSYCHMYSANAGNPLSSGTNSDPSTILRVHCVTCGLDFGYLGSGGAWIQNRQVTVSFGTTFPINLNPNGGGVAIGTPLSAVSYTLQVAGTIGASGDITALYSDERLKTKTGTLENALDKVCSLDTFTYRNNELAKSFGFTDDLQRVGVSAQQVQKVLPEAVRPAPFDAENQSGQNYLTVQYEKLVPLLIESLKEERHLRCQLEERVRALELAFARADKATTNLV
jgi:hypothetical protein